MTLGFPCPAIAQPIQPTTGGTNTTVNQSGNQFNIAGGTLSGDRQNLFHDFEQFGLGSSQIANFLAQPNIVNILGRVTGNQASFIDGLLQVSGGDSNLYLLNPAGIIFGDNASLNVSGDFTATTATGIKLGDNWFKAFGDNDYRNLVGSPTQFLFDLEQPQAIINQGNLAVSTGKNLNLFAGNVQNTGSLTAKSGQINIQAIADKNTIQLSQDGSLLNLEIDTTQLGDSFTAGDLPTLLTGVGNTNISGKIDVSGDVGGEVKVLGEAIALENAIIDASGINGGGDVFAGGEQRGLGNLPNANYVLVDADTTITANALTQGDGGQIIIFAEDIANVSGALAARGGILFGDGGFIETSGLQGFHIATVPDVSASNGKAGTWLIDPFNIQIVAGGGNTDINNTSPFNNPTRRYAQLGVDLITTALNSGANVIVDTGTGARADVTQLDIELNTPLNYTGAAEGTLTLLAGNNIVISDEISATGSGSLNLVLDAARDNTFPFFTSGAIVAKADISTNGGDIDFLDGVYVGGTNNITVNSTGGNINFDKELIVANPNGFTVNSGGGDVTFTGIIDSGNAYSFDATGQTFEQARTNLSSGTGGNVGDTYLATITSAVENSFATQVIPSGCCSTVWIGGSDAAVEGEWRWITGPEGLESSGQGRLFGYTEWQAPNEPANNGDYVRTGDTGLWDDFPATASLGSLVEQNLANSSLTVVSNGGDITFNDDIGTNVGQLGNNLTIETLSVNSGTGKTTFNGANTVANAINVVNEDLELNGAINSAGGDISLSATNLVVNGTTQSTTGNINLSGTTLSASNTIQSTTGNINLNFGDRSTVDSIATTGGNVDISATNDLMANSIVTSGGNINLTSNLGEVITGNLDSSSATGGNVSIIAEQAVTTGIIDTSGATGNGGNVFIDPIGDVEVAYIDAQGGGSGLGGTVDITAGQYFRALGTFIDQNGQTASIATIGGLGNGSITIRHGGQELVPFDIGDASVNGTAGIITNGAFSFLLSESFLSAITRGDLALITASSATPTPTTTTPLLLTPPPSIETPTFNIDFSNVILDLDDSISRIQAGVDPILQDELVFVPLSTVRIQENAAMIAEQADNFFTSAFNNYFASGESAAASRSDVTSSNVANNNSAGAIANNTSSTETSPFESNSIATDPEAIAANNNPSNTATNTQTTENNSESDGALTENASETTA